MDDHLVEPVTREEMLRGQRIYAAPARPPHAERHCDLEELAIEVVSTQTMRELIMRAEDLSERGVRRLLAIFVARKKPKREASVYEWSVAEHRFVQLSLDDEIRDPTLARPLPVRALVDATKADDAVIDALDSKDNRRLQQLKAREREQGLEQGIASLCRVLGIELTPARQAHLHGLDAAGLGQLLRHLEIERSWP
jgi:hypothetical protein